MGALCTQQSGLIRPIFNIIFLRYDPIKDLKNALKMFNKFSTIFLQIFRKETLYP